MQKNLRIASVLALAATALVTTLRITLLPSLQEPVTGLFRLSWLIIGVMLVFVAAALWLCLSARKAPTPAISDYTATSRSPVGVIMVVTGFVILAESLWLMLGGLLFEVAPAINVLDSAAKVLSILSGFAGGAAFVWIGSCLIGAGVKEGNRSGLAMWFPVIWMWFRLVRYEVSHATAIRVEQSFYDFAMLIFIMLFLFSFAQYISGVSRAKSQWKLIFYALCTMVTSLSGSIARVIMYFMSDEAAFNSGRLAGVSDFFIGILSLGLLATFIFAKYTERTAEEMPSETAGIPAE